MFVEAIGGWLTGSLALLSDAGHMLSDAVALDATLMAFKIGEKTAIHQKTFGYKRFEILYEVRKQPPHWKPLLAKIQI